MSLIEKALDAMIFGKKTITSPIFLKDFEKENQQLKDLIELSKKVPADKKEYIDRDIAYLKQGLDGEQNVCYELKNSFVPMLCLHDIRLEYNDYVAQLDFVVITNKFIYVLETKKLNGDIEITADGDFIRIFKTNGGKIIKKEGIYSPISQNERHINILREMLVKAGLIKVLPVKSAVIIANPKTIINKTKCPKSIQNSLYKYDQIANLLKRELSDKKNDLDNLEKFMYAIADFLILNNKPITIDYLSKYSLNENTSISTNTKEEAAAAAVKEEIKETKVEKLAPQSTKPELDLFESLRQYRLKVSREEGIKPYFIYNNEELDLLVQAKPKTKEQLMRVKGFGEKKVEKYGDAVLSIINVK